LYEARQTGQRELVRSVVTSRLLTTEERDALVSGILERDVSAGPQQSPSRFLSNTAHKSDSPEDWYGVRIGHRIHYQRGDSWEEVLCRVDELGRQGAIVGMKFGPLPN